MHQITLKLFASLREQTGFEGGSIHVKASSIAELREELAQRGEAWQAILQAGHVRAALNHRVTEDSASIRDGDEVAFFPPVTGG
ncbi:MAG: molybdopterin converting factor subunit 1 [Betaproteobacteria bacterium]|nr:molybdopterin converting factor subunit 1 [Betaproteobacteria bacterium]NBY14080.1 molybdopterin converting factor subunit 1 [Betaproteobacteria bacterium]NDF04354.1 molybdopterin converting factor subunit 1 [Betaproteobacteria bacterium]